MEGNGEYSELKLTVIVKLLCRAHTAHPSISRGAMYLYCTCIVLVLYLYCTCTVLVLYLYCTCVVLVLYLNRAVTVHNYRYPRVAGKKDKFFTCSNDTLDISATAHLRF